MARGLRAPVLAIIDGNAGLRRAVGLVWPRTAIQRCCVHKLHDLERKAPKHALAEIRDDFHRIVYATNVDTARTAYTAFERTWAKRCPGVVTSLREGGDELLTFFTLPKVQWKTLRTTNTIERLHEEFRRRVKTQGSLPSEGAALILLFSLVAPSDRWRLAPMRGSGVPDKTDRISVAVRGRHGAGTPADPGRPAPRYAVTSIVGEPRGPLSRWNSCAGARCARRTARGTQGTRQH